MLPVPSRVIRLFRFLPRFFVLAGCAFSALCAFAAEPANPHSSARTRAVLDYLAALNSRSDHRVLSGQFTDFGDHGALAIQSKIHARTGRWPAIAGFDYVDFNSGGLATRLANRSAIAHWKEGGLVTVGVHLYNPANPKGGGLRDREVDLQDLLLPGETHRRWMKELDTLADGLQELRDAGVVVLWRPFHEMNGNWFWWGAKPPAAFAPVWRQMFDYFTRIRHLDNLIWLYSPNQRPDAGDYYPGDAFVDLVGLDIYTDHVDPGHIKGYDALIRLPKPFGFAEFGPHGAKDPPGDFDYRALIDGIRRYFPRTVFFMCWNSNWSLASNKEVGALLADPWIANRDDVPVTLSGKTAEAALPSP